VNIILWIIFGGIAGWIASLVMRTDAEMGLGSNIIVGIVGALIGGWVMTLFGGPVISGFNLPSLLVAILGSIILLALIQGLKRPIKGM